MDRLGNNKFLGVKLDLKLALNKSKDKGSKSKEDTAKKEEVDEGKRLKGLNQGVVSLRYQDRVILDVKRKTK